MMVVFCRKKRQSKKENEEGAWKTQLTILLLGYQGRKWWQDGSDPWQTLVACMELTDAIRSGDPENFFSHIPVHQDGSCNGLQHYAGLGRDEYGAKWVFMYNLLILVWFPSEREKVREWPLLS